MACSIGITDVQGILTGGKLTGLTVNGTATVGGCKTVSVQIGCGDALTETLTATVASSGQWTKDFPAPGAALPACAECGAEPGILVKASCTTGGCTVAEGTFVVNCPPACPTITITGQTIGPCWPGGFVTIATTIQVSGGNSFSALAQYNGSTYATITANGTYTVTGKFLTPGPVTFSVQVTSTGSPPLTCANLVSFPETLDLCPPCPSSNLTPTVGQCDSNGNVSVSVTAVVTGSAPFSVQFSDAFGHVQTGGTTSSTGGTVNLVLGPYSYAGGSAQQFTVTTNTPAGCGDESITVNLPSCPTSNGGNSNSSKPSFFCWCCLLVFLVVLVFFAMWACSTFPLATHSIVLPFIGGHFFGPFGAIFATLMILIALLCYQLCPPCNPCWDCRYAMCLFYSSLLAALLILVLAIFGVATVPLVWVSAMVAALLLAGVAAVYAFNARCTTYFSTGNCN